MYVFPLLPVALEKTDILQAQLRDAQDEIVGLKKKSKNLNLSWSRQSLLLSVASQSICLDGGFVEWNSPLRIMCTTTRFLI